MAKTIKEWLTAVSPDGKVPTKKAIETTPFPQENSDLTLLTERLIASALLLGYDHAQNKLNLADEFTTSLDAEPLAFEEATAFLKSKVSMTKDEWEDLEQKLRFRAFTVANLSKCDFIEELRRNLTNSIDKGESLAESWKSIKELSNPAAIKPGHWETVYRTNTQTAYNAGRLMQYENNPPPAWELLFIEDDRTSNTCKGLLATIGGKALPQDHLFWKSTGFPPYHFNCRTTFRAVYDYEKMPTVSENDEKEIEKHFHPQEGFGGHPLDKESWWTLTEKMKERAEEYGITKDIEKFAQDLGMKNYMTKLAGKKGKRKLEGTAYFANIVDGASPKQKELSMAKILQENEKGSFLFTPENKFIQVSNPEGILENKIAEFKDITSKKLDKVEDNILKAAKQNAQVVCIRTPTDSYSKQEAIEIIERTLNYNDIKNVQEVYLIWNNNVISIKK